jgi:hypothetical protein
MWWVVYRRFTRLQFVIIEAGSLAQARDTVSALGLDDGATFQEGHELDGSRSKRVPKAVIGRVLNRRKAEAVLRKLEET